MALGDKYTDQANAFVARRIVISGSGRLARSQILKSSSTWWMLVVDVACCMPFEQAPRALIGDFVRFGRRPTAESQFFAPHGIAEISDFDPRYLGP